MSMRYGVNLCCYFKTHYVIKCVLKCDCISKSIFIKIILFEIVRPLIFVCITESVRLVCLFYLYVPFFIDYFMTLNNVVLHNVS